jgi:predicted transcriptional regulator
MLTLTVSIVSCQYLKMYPEELQEVENVTEEIGKILIESTISEVNQNNRALNSLEYNSNIFIVQCCLH